MGQAKVNNINNTHTVALDQPQGRVDTPGSPTMGINTPRTKVKLRYPPRKYTGIERLPGGEKQLTKGIITLSPGLTISHRTRLWIYTLAGNTYNFLHYYNCTLLNKLYQAHKEYG